MVSEITFKTHSGYRGSHAAQLPTSWDSMTESEQGAWVSSELQTVGFCDVSVYVVEAENDLHEADGEWAMFDRNR